MYRILLVKDDPAIRELIVHSFTKKEKGAFEADTASDEQEGLEKPGKTV